MTPVREFTYVDEQTLSGPEGETYSVLEAVDQLPWVRQWCPFMPHEYAILGKSPEQAWYVLEAMIRLSPRRYKAFFRGYQSRTAIGKLRTDAGTGAESRDRPLGCCRHHRSPPARRGGACHQGLGWAAICPERRGLLRPDLERQVVAQREVLRRGLRTLQGVPQATCRTHGTGMSGDRCAQCGSRLKLLPVSYGLPGPELGEASERGEVILGGCVAKAIDEACSVCHLHPTLISEPITNGILLPRWEAVPRTGISRQQRLAGGIWGHLVGDAIGVPYEFQRADQITGVELRGHGTHNQPPGTWSDDGSLMLALLDALATSARFDLDDQARRFLQWADAGAYTPDGDGGFDIGNATAKALANLRAGVPPIDAGRTGADDAGNGSLMRILPIALIDDGASDAQSVDHAHLASRVTHADPRCQVACALYVLVARHLLDGAEREPALESSVASLREVYAASEPWSAELLPALELLLDRRSNVQYGSGYVLDTFWSAWDAFMEADDYRGTIERAVGFGRDTDTTAAVAGGLAGIYWGVTNIPQDWLSALRGQETVEVIVAETMARAQ